MAQSPGVWQHIRILTTAILVVMSEAGSCTPLVVAREGRTLILASNTTDSEGKPHCKLHFAKNAIVMRATQAASVKFIWPDGRIERIDFDEELDGSIQNMEGPLDLIETHIIEEAERRIVSVLERYEPMSGARRALSQDLISEYVIAGRERNGFLGIRAFTIRVSNPETITFDVHDLPSTIRNKQIVDYSEEDVAIYKPVGSQSPSELISSILLDRTRSAKASGNEAFSPPYVLVEVSRSGFRFLTATGPCRSKK